MDLKLKMVFIGGPRQVGKKTLALSYLSDSNTRSLAYLNWDDISDRSKLLQGELPPNEKIIILDEIHRLRQGQWNLFLD